MRLLLSAIRSGISPAAALLFCLLAIRAFAGNCYIGGPCFATVDPYMGERVCYLYAHETMSYKVGTMWEEATVGALSSIELHPDRLHVEFLRLITEKKFLPLKRGTQVFSCPYDLNLIKADMDQARMRGAVLPEINCRGFLFAMVPVRPINLNTCYWVAEVDVRCEEQVPLPTTPFDLFEEKLKEK